jgi:hypothetical protein
MEGGYTQNRSQDYLDFVSIFQPSSFAIIRKSGCIFVSLTRG